MGSGMGTIPYQLEDLQAVDNMVQTLQAHNTIPSDFLGDLVDSAWLTSPPGYLGIVLQPGYDWASDGPPENLPELLENIGRTFIFEVAVAHMQMLLQHTWSCPAVVNLVLSMLQKANMSVSEYLTHCLAKEAEKNSPLQIAQQFLHEPSIFQILLNSDDKSPAETMAAIYALYNVQPGAVAAIDAFYFNVEPGAVPVVVSFTKETATDFVTALPTVDISSIPKEDLRCPHCWLDFDEVYPPDVNHTVKKTVCGHTFGHDCLVESLIGKPATAPPCPMCRQDMAALSARAG